MTHFSPKHHGDRLRHPVAWAHAAFCDRILNTGEGAYPEVRASLQRLQGLTLPDDQSDPAYDDRAHYDAFMGFLKFLKSNLAAQTAMRVDPAWGMGAGSLSGIGWRADDPDEDGQLVIRTQLQILF